MAFTGELEQLNIVDIIQLLNTTRKSGTFSVRGSKGESRIIFSNGSIVGASHLNGKVRIGTVLVKMNAITGKDLEEALAVQKRAGRERKPLISTLIELGRLRRAEAVRGLKKLIEMTLVEIVGWTAGTFTLDTDAITVSPECSYPVSKMEQEISLDAQMILMDALRIFDERERDHQAGKAVQSTEELYADIAPSSDVAGSGKKIPAITADDLGLGEVDHLERKIPQFVQATEAFDPAQIHRQKIRETLADFPVDAQETFVSFLEQSASSRIAHEGPQRRDERTNGLILFSEDRLVTHSVLTICKEEGVLVFATEGEEELDRIIAQCLTIKVMPILVFDDPETSEGLFSRAKIVGLRRQVKERYPDVPIVQMASLLDYPFTLQSFRDGMRAVFPKPSREARKSTFIADAIEFLETFKSYVKDFFEGQQVTRAGSNLAGLKERIMALRDLKELSELSFVLLRCVSEVCERSISFAVGATELVGEKAIGVFAEKDSGPTSVTRLKIPLPKSSVFREIIEKRPFFCGEVADEAVSKHLFEAIGEPLSPTVLLLPMRSRGKTVSLTYGDFGGQEVSPVPGDALEILAHEAGLVLENTLYRSLVRRQVRNDDTTK